MNDRRDVVLVKVKTLTITHRSEIDGIDPVRFGRNDRWCHVPEETPVDGLEPLVCLYL